jgi:hypothetical protein
LPFGIALEGCVKKELIMRKEKVHWTEEEIKAFINKCEIVKEEVK